MAPAGGESSKQNSRLTRQLDIWADQDGRGHSFDSSVNFVFPDGSKRSPDASWVSIGRLETLTHEERRKFFKVGPRVHRRNQIPFRPLSRVTSQDGGISSKWRYSRLAHPPRQTNRRNLPARLGCRSHGAAGNARRRRTRQRFCFRPQTNLARVELLTRNFLPGGSSPPPGDRRLK